MSDEKPKYRTLREKYSPEAQAQEKRALQDEHARKTYKAPYPYEFTRGYEQLDEYDTDMLRYAEYQIEHADDDDDARKLSNQQLLRLTQFQYDQKAEQLAQSRREYEIAYDRGRQLQMQHDQAVARLNQR